MSWLFSRALVEEFSADICSGGEPSAQLSVMPTQHKFWRSDRTMEPSDLSRFGLTCEVLTEACGEALLMSFRAASHARTSVPPAREPDSTESAAGFGEKWRESWARFDPDTCSWRTPQFSLLGGLEPFSGIWPRSGSMQRGECYPLPMSARRTSVSAFGLWPTPTVCGNYNRKGASAQSGDGLATAVKAWPTPTSSLGTKGGRVTPRKSRHGGTLIEAVSAAWWPTPHGFSPDGKSNSPSGNELGRAVNRAGTTGGSLNPTWVEWLMGWPIEWTALRQSATDKYRSWRQQHSPLSQPSSGEAA